jgi:chemotaxis protein MotB
MARKKDPVVMGAPEWVVTYGDCMSLLLCFFVIIVSMSEIKKDESFRAAAQSIRAAFGGEDGAAYGGHEDVLRIDKLLEMLQQLEVNVQKQDPSIADEEGVEGRKFRVTNVRQGIELVVGGNVAFDRFSAALKPEAKEIVARTGDLLAGYNTKIMIRGHATLEALPPDSIYDSPLDLSYERARAAATILEERGVDRRRIVIAAVGDTEPLKCQVYTEDRLAQNRRVEIIVTEDTPEDYSGATQAEDRKEEP